MVSGSSECGKAERLQKRAILHDSSHVAARGRFNDPLLSSRYILRARLALVNSGYIPFSSSSYTPPPPPPQPLPPTHVNARTFVTLYSRASFFLSLSLPKRGLKNKFWSSPLYFHRLLTRRRYETRVWFRWGSKGETYIYIYMLRDFYWMLRGLVESMRINVIINICLCFYFHFCI